MNIIDLATKTMQTAIKSVVDVTKTKVDGIDITTKRLRENGSVTFSTPGTHTWTAPLTVNSVTLTMFGGGGGGGFNGGNGTRGGGGGAYVYRVPIQVVPGQTYTLIVGSGGNANSSGNGYSGGASSAFGITCSGGGGGGIASEIKNNGAPSTNPIVTRGAAGGVQGETNFGERTPFAEGGGAETPNSGPAGGGGGAGFGRGSNGRWRDTVPAINAGLGAGGGSSASTLGPAPTSGGNGIIIVEW